MNNEEKILQMLEKLTEDVSEMRQDVNTLKEDFVEMRQDVDTLKEDQKNMRETLTQVALVQENVVLPRLAALAEGHDAILSACAPKEQTEKRLGDLEGDMSVVKNVVGMHSAKLVELEKKAQ